MTATKTINISDFTRADFENSEPYSFLHGLRGDPFLFEQTRRKMADHAKSVGYTSFTTSYKAFAKSMKNLNSFELLEGEADLEELAIKDLKDINTGPWVVDSESGEIYRDTERGAEIACPHFIFPYRVMTDAETGMEKVEVVWKRRGRVHQQIVDRETLAVASKITALSKFGVAVTSENAKALVRWMADAESLNLNAIKEEKSVGRLGYIRDYGFSPYAKELNYDGNPDFRDIYASIHPEGSFEKWKNAIAKIRSGGRMEPRFLLASSFASVLLEPLGNLSFFVHLYGGSGNGKTVALMVASSVWGDPGGSYLRTFNATTVGMEMLAGFLHNLPLCMDELQIQRTNGKDFDNMIYQLTEGIGRTRGSKNGGLKEIAKWKLSVLTSGETPIVSASSAGGTVNRVIEVDATDVEHLFDNDTELVEVVKKNYGHAGKKFIEALKDADIEELKTRQQAFCHDLSAMGITDKQAIAGSAILVADSLMEEYIFNDGIFMDIGDVAQYLKKGAEVSENSRAWEWFRGWLNINIHRFDPNNSSMGLEMWGKIQGTYVDIIKTVFNKALSEEGFNPDNFAKWLKKQGLLYSTKTGRTTHNIRLGYGGSVSCIPVVLVNDED